MLTTMQTNWLQTLKAFLMGRWETLAQANVLDLALEEAIALGIILFLVLLVYVLGRLVLLPMAQSLARRTHFTWDDLFIKYHVFANVMLLLPAAVLVEAAVLSPRFSGPLQLCGNLWFLYLLLRLVDRLLSVFLAIYNRTPLGRTRPLKGYLQLIKIVLYGLGVVLALSILLNQSPLALLSGIGALTAILVLIFRDTILSFVASIQIAANDLFRVGDWIQMDAFGADGEVEDIALNTVTVRNFDKTLVAIPAHKFLDHSFTNWRGMVESGGRRIKRSLLIDQSSVRFLNDEDLERLTKLELISDYLEERQTEIDAANAAAQVDTSTPGNGRQQTNLGAFRAYVGRYLSAHPNIRGDFTRMVRQLDPTGNEGLPLQIYCFTDTTAWVAYETIQADIFDHLLAVLPLFGLRAYQRNALPDRRVRAEGRPESRPETQETTGPQERSGKGGA